MATVTGNVTGNGLPNPGNKKAPHRAFRLMRGQCAPEGIRTPNLLIRSQMLYPLSYGRWSYYLLPACRSHGRPTRTLPPVRRGPKLKPTIPEENSVTALRRAVVHELNRRSGASHRKGPGRHARPGPSWRRRRDLNPRTGCPVTTLAGWRTRPDYATSPRGSLC